MRKAKFILVALFFIAILGGSLSFKTKQQRNFYTYDTNLENPTTCNVSVPMYYTITIVLEDGFIICSTTQPTTYNPNSDCPCGTTLVKESN